MLAFVSICLAVAVVAVPVPDPELLPPRLLVIPAPAPLRTSQFIPLSADLPAPAIKEAKLSPSEEPDEDPAEEAVENLPRSEEAPEEEHREEPKPALPAAPAAPAFKPEELKPIMIKLEDPAPPTTSSGILSLIPFQIPNLSSLGSFIPTISRPSWLTLPSWPSWLPSLPGASGSQRYISLRYPTYVYAEK
ncbi:uncharacterized protein LOC126366944 [Pectinophora gossypiella]|uniref:uncharacterized protein LOC126366944 n=1 Tax=Pectinophora gossypiella TaxID=13191 RepID=UPI00214F36EF|nr:uncharacterized protein LOC126366944 [Pectinophora gossypiella]